MAYLEIMLDAATDLTLNISPYSFSESIERVYINEGITSVADSAFSTSGLGEVHLPNSLVSIGSNAFNDSGLTAISIPKSVKNIGWNAFSNNNPLTITFLNRTSTDDITFEGSTWWDNTTVIEYR